MGLGTLVGVVISMGSDKNKNKHIWKLNNILSIKCMVRFIMSRLRELYLCMFLG